MGFGGRFPALIYPNTSIGAFVFWECLRDAQGLNVCVARHLKVLGRLDLLLAFHPRDLWSCIVHQMIKLINVVTRSQTTRHQLGIATVRRDYSFLVSIYAVSSAHDS
jgi:hypothetical protein